MALSLAVLIGGISEYLQIEGPRDADFIDLLRDITGAASFLGIYMMFDRNIKSYQGIWRGKAKAVIFYMAISSIILTLIPVALKGAAYFHRKKVFPAICTFESILENYYVKANDAKLEKVMFPDGIGDSNNGRIGHITYFIAPYPGLIIEEPYPDWGGYEYLSFMVYSKLREPVTLGIRIDDGFYNGTYQDRFNGEFHVEPGRNTIQIPVDKIKHGPFTREMDISRIRALYIFASYPDESFSLYIGDIGLR